MNCGFERRYGGRGLIPFGPASLRACGPVLRGGRPSAAVVLSLALLVVGIFGGAQAMADQAPGEKEIATQDVQSPFTVRVQRNTVLVRVVVRDSKGRVVGGLRKEDFRISEWMESTLRQDRSWCSFDFAMPCLRGSYKPE